MREVSRRYFYSTVRLRLRFMRGLHPFFPPSVEIVWPHFKGPMLDAVASHPMLRLENWDPWRPAMETVRQIKAFLEANARVDLDNPANDIRRHPHSTYSPLERGLARLEALSGVLPTSLQQPEVAALYAARDSYDKDTARLQALAEAGKKRSRSEPGSGKRTREVVWARGTGYGSGHDKSSEQWDAKATDAAQRARDSEIQALLEEMYNSLVRELGPRLLLLEEEEDAQVLLREEGQQKKPEVDDSAGPTAMEGVEMMAAAAGAGAQEISEAVEPAGTGCGSAATGVVTLVEANAPAAAAVGGSIGDETEPRLGAERCAAVLRDSCLLPFVVRELHLASFTDMGARHKYYLALLALLRELCRPSTHDMLWSEVGPRPPGQGGSEPAGPGHSVATILTTALRSAAKLYLSVLGLATVQAEKGAASAALGASTSTVVPPTRVPDRSAIAAENAAREAEATQRITRIIMQIAAYIDVNTPGGGAPAAEAASVIQATQGASQPHAGASTAAAAAAEAAERAASGAQASTSAAGAASASAEGPSLYVKTLKTLQVCDRPVEFSHSIAVNVPRGGSNNDRSGKSAPRCSEEYLTMLRKRSAPMAVASSNPNDGLRTKRSPESPCSLMPAPRPGLLRATIRYPLVSTLWLWLYLHVATCRLITCRCHDIYRAPQPVSLGMGWVWAFSYPHTVASCTLFC
ncbi:hypothetical protein Vretimale_8765 [Volvox reticuliferus]|uniref:UBC core domain-containing protein n=1 Tax=Volvox reticuliferus TaxID=1737510 RepID=A0A8J4GCA5_9CHLO|nr:hypothetical protein Vretifemale_6208 [Volvox reticuliferus]GIM04220.1 hypothetical protein Vretimale_8765 [Volvox reticuliferus]